MNIHTFNNECISDCVRASVSVCVNHYPVNIVCICASVRASVRVCMYVDLFKNVSIISVCVRASEGRACVCVIQYVIYG